MANLVLRVLSFRFKAALITRALVSSFEKSHTVIENEANEVLEKTNC